MTTQLRAAYASNFVEKIKIRRMDCCFSTLMSREYRPFHEFCRIFLKFSLFFSPPFSTTTLHVIGCHIAHSRQRRNKLFFFSTVLLKKAEIIRKTFDVRKNTVEQMNQPYFVFKRRRGTLCVNAAHVASDQPVLFFFRAEFRNDYLCSERKAWR